MAATSWFVWIIYITVLNQYYIKKSSGASILSIKFLTFSNHHGLTYGGQCCDGKGLQCTSKCDHSFDVCISTWHFKSVTKACPHGRVQTGEVMDANYITFGDHVGSVKNPLLFRINKWPKLILIRIDITDVDGDSNHRREDEDRESDYVGHLQRRIPMFPNNVSRTLFLQDKVQLSIEVRGVCDRDYYGLECDVYCSAGSEALPRYSCDDQGRKKCLPGWAGQNCSQDNEDNCADFPCLNGATCKDAVKAFECLCPPQFTGVQCQTDTNECQQVPGLCGNGSCVNEFGSFRCMCDPGYTGPLCQEDIDECQTSPCQNSGVCTESNTIGEFHCQCPKNFTGKLCDNNVNECQLERQCKNNGTCIDTFGSFYCSCSKFWTGFRCEENVNECLSNPCLQDGSVCRDLERGFQCICVDGWSGEVCSEDKDECKEVGVCGHGGTCVNTDGSYMCSCDKGWSGTHCEIDVDECAKDVGVCKNGGSCVNLNGGFRCDCISAWQDERCETDVDECNSEGGELCAENATESCENRPGHFTCVCHEGWRGALCDQDIDECAENPNVCHALTTPKNLDKEDNRENDKHIEASQSYRPFSVQSEDKGGKRKKETDVESIQGYVPESLSIRNRTRERFVCTNAQPGYTCECASGWTGTRCEQLAILLQESVSTGPQTPTPLHTALPSVGSDSSSSFTLYLTIGFILLGALVIGCVILYYCRRRRRRRTIKIANVTYQNEGYEAEIPSSTLPRNGLHGNNYANKNMADNTMVVIPDIIKDDAALDEVELPVPTPALIPPLDTLRHYELPSEEADPSPDDVMSRDLNSVGITSDDRNGGLAINNADDVSDRVYVTKVNYVIADGVLRQPSIEDPYEHLPYIDSCTGEQWPPITVLAPPRVVLSPPKDV